MIEEKGSFRDPAGKIFYHKNKVYRKLSNLGKERLKFILEENILEESIKNSFIINSTDLILLSLMIVTVGVSFVFISIAPQFISSPEVGIFFLLETALGPLWVWFFISEAPTQKTLIGGIFIIIIIFLSLIHI